MYRVSLGLSPFRGLPRGWGYLHGQLEKVAPYVSFLTPRIALSAREPLARTMGGAVSMVLSTGARTQEGLQRISEANLKHGRQTKDKLAAQRHAAKVGRRVLGELKRLERQLKNAGLMPDD